MIKHKSLQCILLLLLLVTSCTNSSVYEIENSKFKVLRSPVTTFTDSVLRMNLENKQIMKEFAADDFSPVPFYYAGLTPRVPMILVFYRNSSVKSCLSQEGGFMQRYKCLVVKDSGKNILIDSKEKAARYFAPIQSKQEAVSYMTLLTNSRPLYDFSFVKKDFVFTKTKLNKTFADSLPDGYLVHLFDHPVFGCHHPYSEITYKLDIKGNFTIVNIEEVFSDPAEEGMCVD